MADVKAHTLEITVRVPEWVPEHAQRTESAEFAKNRQQIIDDGFGYCLGCDLAGKHVTEGLQCHHYAVEWAEWDDADPVKVLRSIKRQDPYGYAAKDPDSPVESPDDIRNLMMLCQPCHTGAPKQPNDQSADPAGYESGGIHYCPYPVWEAERTRKAVST